MNQLKILEKNFTPPSIPLLFIKFYRWIKSLLN